MLLDPATLDLAPRAPEVLSWLAGDPRFKLELPAAQLELVTLPCDSITAATAELAGARRDLAAAAQGRLRMAGAGVHPFANGRGVLNLEPRYAEIVAGYGELARRQLVFGLHIHVGVPGANRALAVYNALRAYLPEIAALAGNAPFYEGADSGLASVRPKLCELLPRQGVPPALESWQALASALEWGARSGRFPDPRHWWWELRLHPVHGTVELRVADTQSTVADTAGIAAFAHALVHHLARRHDAGESFDPAATWRIEENRWSAARFGLDGELNDLVTGEPTGTRDRLRALLDDLGKDAEQAGCAAELAEARRLVEANGAERQRTIAADRGVLEMTRSLSDAFAPAPVSRREPPG